MIATSAVLTNDQLTTKYGRTWGYACWRPKGCTPKGNVFLLHSLGFDKHSLWDAIARKICQEFNMVVYSFDLPGHGDSFIDMTGITYDCIEADIANIIGSLHIAPCHYVGCSLGSEFGLRLSVNHPELLNSLVVIGASSIRSSKEEEQVFGMLIKQWRSKGMLALADFILSEPFMFGKAFLEDPKFEQQRKTQWARISKIHLNSLRLWELWIYRKITVNYSRVKVPLLIMCGSDDEYFLPHAENLMAMVPRAHLKLIKDVGHEAPIEAPEETYQNIKEFWLHLFSFKDYFDRSASQLNRKELPSTENRFAS